MMALTLVRRWLNGQDVTASQGWVQVVDTHTV